MIVKEIYLTVFILLVLSCSPQKKLVNFEKEDFTISYPTYLSLNDVGKEGTIFILKTLKEGESDSFIENINLVKANVGNLSLEDLTSKTITDLESVANILEVKQINVNGSNCLRVIFKLSEREKEMKVIQHFFIKDKKVYVLTFISEEDKFNQYYDDMNSVLMSFKLK